MSYEPGCDRVASVHDSVTGTIQYTYTPMGSVRTRTLPNGTTWAYTYLRCQPLYDADPGDKNPDPPGYHTVSDQDNPNSYGEVLGEVLDSNGKIVCGWGTFGTKTFDFRYSTDSNGNEYISGYCEEFRIYDSDGVDYYHNQNSLDQTRCLLTEIAYYDWTRDSSSTNVFTPRLISRSTYEYDALGRRTDNHRYGVEDAHLGDEHYEYDNLSRLTSARYTDYGSDGTPLPANTDHFAYDAMGNRVSDTKDGRSDDPKSWNYEYNAANMLISKDETDYINDANGNTLSGGGRGNTWDSQNRLARCVKDGVSTSFIYGPDGLRRSMTVNNGTSSTTTDYLLDGQNVVQELNETNFGGVRTLTPTVTYGMGPRGIEYREDASGRKWYIYDGLGSVVAEVDSGQSSTDGSVTVTATRAYNAYGAVRSSSGTSASSHKFCGGLGHTTDATGLIYMRARYYDPEIGRFISEDPAGDGADLYTYCDSNPVCRYDADGNEWSLAGLNVGVAIGEGLVSAMLDAGLQYLFNDGKINWTGVALSGAIGLAGGAVRSIVFTGRLGAGGCYMKYTCNTTG